MRRWKCKGIEVARLVRTPLRVPRGGAWTRTAQAHKRAHLFCAHCGRLDRLTTDHIIPRHKGGTDDWANLQSLCVECHKIKTAQEAAEG